MIKLLVPVNLVLVFAASGVLLLLVGDKQVNAAPATDLNVLSRVKRVSDQRLAELETLVALNRKLHGKVVTVPLGFGKLDPKLLGRKRRSEFNFDLQDNLQQLENNPQPKDYDEEYELLQLYYPGDSRFYEKH